MIILFILIHYITPTKVTIPWEIEKRRLNGRSWLGAVTLWLTLNQAPYLGGVILIRTPPAIGID